MKTLIIEMIKKIEDEEMLKTIYFFVRGFCISIKEK